MVVWHIGDEYRVPDLEVTAVEITPGTNIIG